MSAETKTPAPSTTTLFDLVSDFNRFNLKNMLWLQERALELSKILVKRAESFQVESRSIVEEYMAQARRAGQVSQSYFRQGLQSTVETAREYETTSRIVAMSFCEPRS